MANFVLREFGFHDAGCVAIPAIACDVRALPHSSAPTLGACHAHIGKSALAKALVRDRQVREAFPDECVRVIQHQGML